MTYDDAFMDGYYSAMEDMDDDYDGLYDPAYEVSLSDYGAKIGGYTAAAIGAKYGSAALYKVAANHRESKKSGIQKLAGKIAKIFNKIKLWVYEHIPKFIKKLIIKGYDEKNDRVLKELKYKAMDLTEKAKAFGDGIGKQLMNNTTSVTISLVGDLLIDSYEGRNFLHLATGVHNLANSLDATVNFIKGIRSATV